ncbi:hypothetical protein RHMOL_Rhmol02G0305900 [Rhododendron molle]|uniref:Uncharacterized protein n=1 Tax=Rhododendron molle TaxID=49168 RepID=A0ACC0PYS1_RHOML|nr:hypothetical protein RHMOL_Rhmol02G0305900 [Rhododendron molle]
MNEEARGKAILRVTQSELPQAGEIIADDVDVLAKILARLPRKSVARFKSVSKHWLSLLSSIAGCGGDDLYKELWKACAGPLMEVPRVGERVVYFPQGPMEQLEASTNVEPNQRAPLFNPLNLPSQIRCIVMDIQLRADSDSDEVYAHITLLPEQDQSEPTSPDLCPPEPLTPMLKSFCKVLTASDCIGGFSVPLRHANECLPALDMNQPTLMQELIAKDLHGREWRFKHIFRGQPKRHMLATGWSRFVSSKRLVAGDSVVFLRGENGELQVGVRRAARQQSTMPSSLISIQNMHIGLQGAASLALAQRTIFFVPNKPRFTGTIVGVEDLSAHWENSKWRSLRVRWDEAASIPRPERVSPWEIEPIVMVFDIDLRNPPNAR